MAMPGEFDVQAETISDTAVLRVAGELDLATADRVEDAIATVSATRLVIDLTRCTFLDSSGVRVLAACVRAFSAEGRSVRLVATEPGILRVLEITGLDTLIPLHPTVDDAL